MEKVRAGFLDLAVLYDPQHCPEARIEPLDREELIYSVCLPSKSRSRRRAGVHAAAESACEVGPWVRACPEGEG